LFREQQEFLQLPGKPRTRCDPESRSGTSGYGKFQN
jgi:hypothetical protein